MSAFHPSDALASQPVISLLAEKDGTIWVGTFRGGLGFRKRYRILAPCTVQTNLDRTKFPPWGVRGGKEAKTGRFTLVDAASGECREIGKEKGLALKAGDLLCVETGGGTMDSILQLTVFLTAIDNYDGLNKVFKTYFPNGGPARTCVAVAALPGNSLVEINCTAAVVRK